MKKYFKIFLIIIAMAVVFLFLKYDLKSYLTIDFLQKNRESLLSYYSQHKVSFILAYVGVYIITTALSLPGAAILSLAGGGILGNIIGFFAVSVASTIGATLAFLSARFLFRDVMLRKFSKQLKTINEGVQKEGPFYLFALRLVPAFPFFLINIVMGLTNMKTLTFFIVSQLGMLPGTFVFVNAGTQVAKIKSPGDILSPAIIISFLLLGLFPILAKKLLALRKRK